MKKTKLSPADDGLLALAEENAKIRKERIEFLSKISSKLSPQKTYKQWVAYYDSLTDSRLADEWRSYQC